MEHKCKNCKLYSPKEKLCAVIIPLTEQMQKEFNTKDNKLQLKPDPDDFCFYEQEFRALDREKMSVERFNIEVQEIKMWTEDPVTGVKCKDGVVKVEMPSNFLPEGFLSGKKED